MRIITPGKLPEEMVARTICNHCKCVFEFTKAEAKRTSDQRDGDFYTIACPTCKEPCHVAAKAFTHLPIKYVDPRGISPDER